MNGTGEKINISLVVVAIEGNDLRFHNNGQKCEIKWVSTHKTGIMKTMGQQVEVVKPRHCFYCGVRQQSREEFSVLLHMLSLSVEPL